MVNEQKLVEATGKQEQKRFVNEQKWVEKVHKWLRCNYVETSCN